jgi:putative metal-binding protein
MDTLRSVSAHVLLLVALLFRSNAILGHEPTLPPHVKQKASVAKAQVAPDDTLRAAICFDNDEDGYVDYSGGCWPPSSATCGDCNDADASIHPGASEVCNGTDDDCDGTIDEDLGQTTCFGGPPGICEHVIDNCVDGVPQRCNEEFRNIEVCNGLDDDCDGYTDEVPWCQAGVGACTRFGTAVCQGGTYPECTVEPGSPTPGVGGGDDNNCDGIPDEILTRTCSTACGEGQEIYIGQWSLCTAVSCCVCTVGPDSTYQTLCSAVEDSNCWSICLSPGTYTLEPECTLDYKSLRSLEGLGTVTILGDVTGGSRVQGLVVTGTLDARGHSTDYYGNVASGLISNSDGDGINAVIGNLVYGDLSATSGYYIIENIVRGGGIAGGGRGGNAIIKNEVSGNGGTCISMLRYARIERNRVSGCDIGIEKYESSCCRSGNIVGNEVSDVAIGVLARLQEGADMEIVSNRIRGAREVGVDVLWDGRGDGLNLHVTQNLIDGRGENGDSNPDSVGVRIASAVVETWNNAWLNIESNTIVNNGRGIVLDVSSESLTPVFLVGNIVSGNGEAGVSSMMRSPFSAKDNLVANNGLNWEGLADQSGVRGNFSAAPMFKGGEKDEFMLMPGSPGVDAATRSSTGTDLAGAPRGLDGDLDGIGRPDIGAYEFRPEIGDLRYVGDPIHAAWSANPYANNGYDIYWVNLDTGALPPEFTQQVCGWPATDYPISAIGNGVANVMFVVVPHGSVSGGLGQDSGGHDREPVSWCP